MPARQRPMGIEVELQKALFLRLSGGGTDAVSVYDTAPQAGDGGDDALFPYVTMGRMVITPMDTKVVIGFAAQIRIHTYSRTGSMLECKAIQGQIFDLLHRNELTIVGHHNVSLVREDTDCFSSQDGGIHGVCEYRALIEETA